MKGQDTLWGRKLVCFQTKSKSSLISYKLENLYSIADGLWCINIWKSVLSLLICMSITFFSGWIAVFRQFLADICHWACEFQLYLHLIKSKWPPGHAERLTLKIQLFFPFILRLNSVKVTYSVALVSSICKVVITVPLLQTAHAALWMTDFWHFSKVLTTRLMFLRGSCILVGTLLYL